MIDDRDFRRDRVGGTLHARTHHRVTYLAHGKGYVMCRHPGCMPFCVTEKEWLSYPFYEKPNFPVGGSDHENR